MIQALIGPATKLLGKFIEDKDTKNKLAHDIATMAEKHAQELAKSQIEVNKMEAQSGHWFVAWETFYWLGVWYRFGMALCLSALCYIFYCYVWCHYATIA